MHQRFGRLLVVAEAPSRLGRTYWLCRCDCGRETEVQRTHLIRGGTVSCGCYNRETFHLKGRRHGLRHTPEYTSFQSMHQRCENPRATSYDRYGGRGIAVCERWADFANFIADMGPRPTLEHSLERINNNLGYSPENCKWATNVEQMNNTRACRYYEWNDQCKTAAQWAVHFGVERHVNAFRERLSRGWTLERAASVPFGKNGPHPLPRL